MASWNSETWLPKQTSKGGVMKADQRLPRVSLLTAIAILVVATAIIATAQKKDKSWLELPRKDAEKLLTNSPWSQTQVDTDVSEMFFSPTRQGSPSAGRSNASNITDQQKVNNNRADRGAVNQSVSITYRICFLSARPI